MNTVGVMGKGIALEFRRRYPEMCADYVERCRRGEVRLGEPYLYTGYLRPWILNFPTKDHWRSAARLSDITAGLDFVVRNAHAWRIESLACPPLGCGQGRLEWRVVGRILYKYLRLLNVPIELYAPRGTPADQLTAEFLSAPPPSGVYEARLRPYEIALAEIVHRIEREPYHWRVGRTTFQKLGYFATELGLPTGYDFGRASFGPFTRDVQSLIGRLVNNGLLDEAREENLLRLRPGHGQREAREEFAAELLSYEGVISKVVDLALRLSPTQLEIAATAHFVAKRLGAGGRRPNEADVHLAVLDWKKRRRPNLDPDEIAMTIRALNLLGIVDVDFVDDLVPAAATVA